MGRYYSPPSLYPPCPSALAPLLAALKEMVTHINQVHGVHLLSNRILLLIPEGEEISIEISEQEWLASPGAFQPGLMNVQ